MFFRCNASAVMSPDTGSGLSRNGMSVIAHVEIGFSTSAVTDSTILFSLSLIHVFSFFLVQCLRRDVSRHRQWIVEKTHVCYCQSWHRCLHVSSYRFYFSILIIIIHYIFFRYDTSAVTSANTRSGVSKEGTSVIAHVGTDIYTSAVTDSTFPFCWCTVPENRKNKCVCYFWWLDTSVISDDQIVFPFQQLQILLFYFVYY